MTSEKHEPVDSNTDEPSGPLRRTVLVDGFNVLHAVLLGADRAGGWWRRAFRERLLERVRSWDGGADEIWVAFDGTRPATSVWAEPVATPQGSPGSAPPGPTVHSVFVESADDWIVRRARRAEHPEQLIVVSADRKVAGRARSAGCEILTPWAFIALCPQEGPQEGPEKSPEESLNIPYPGPADERPDDASDESSGDAPELRSEDHSRDPTLASNDAEAPESGDATPRAHTLTSRPSCAVA